MLRMQKLTRLVIWSLALGLMGALLPLSDADAAIVTLYDEDFDDDVGEGIIGPVPPNLPIAADNSGQWSVDGTGAEFTDSDDFAWVATGGELHLHDIGNTTGGTPGIAGSVVFSSAVVPVLGSSWESLALTLTVRSTANGGLDDSVIVESLINGIVQEKTLLVGNFGTTQVTHDLVESGLGGLFAGGGTYQARVTFTQNDAPANHYLDDILLQGEAAPEPTSLALMGMAACAAFGCRYRRRRRSL